MESTRHVGGLVTSGLSQMDFRTYEGLSGLFLDFAHRVEAHHREAYGAQSKQVRACRRGTQAEPHVNDRVFELILSEQPSLTVCKGLRLASLQLGETTETRRTMTRVTRTSAPTPLHLEADEYAADPLQGEITLPTTTAKSEDPLEMPQRTARSEKS